MDPPAAQAAAHDFPMYNDDIGAQQTLWRSGNDHVSAGASARISNAAVGSITAHAQALIPFSAPSESNEALTVSGVTSTDQPFIHSRRRSTTHRRRSSHFYAREVQSALGPSGPKFDDTLQTATIWNASQQQE